MTIRGDEEGGGKDLGTVTKGWLRWCVNPFLALSILLVSGERSQLTAQAETWGRVLAEFSEEIAAEVQGDDLGGITAGVVVGRDLVWARGFGWADAERKIPAGVNTIYRIGSISKSITRPAVGPDVTFRHLASHTAGLMREPELEGATEGPLELWEEKLLASIPTTSFYAAPGESYQYSNIGFGMLGYSLSRAAGIPFMELVDAAIFRPLGMQATGFVVTPAMAEQLATGYERRRDGTVDTRVPLLEHVGRGYKVPNGGVYSTVGDLGRFVAGLTNSATVPLLGPEARKLIRTPQTPEGSRTQYSIGFFLFPQAEGGVFVGHSGSVAGYNAFLVFEPGSGIGVVMLRNYLGGATNLGEASRGLLSRLLASK
jgi:CubicO group peptidase (beta-lactamase class C family)